MKKPMKVVSKPVINTSALEAPSQGARRASEEGASSAAPSDPEVVALARRRQFSPSERRRILAAADRCSEPGAIGALLRREGIYSSYLRTWRKQRAAQEVLGVGSSRRGPKPNPATGEAHRSAQLVREIERLRRQLAQAHLIIEVQKKVAALLSLPVTHGTNAEYA